MDETKDAMVRGQVRALLLSAFARMDEVDAVLHPWAMEDFWRMAELLEIDSSIIPTETRAISRRAGDV